MERRGYMSKVGRLLPAAHYQDLVLRLREAGFQEVQSDYDDAKDAYTVMARTDNKLVQATRA
jgi:hypothetical protein